MRTHFLVAAMTAVLAVQPANAQRLGKGGMGVDETAELPRCSKPLGSIALVEDKGAPKVEDQLPPGMRALMQMAERQNGGPTKVDPLPVLKLLTAQSNCFALVERGAAFDALQRERELAAGGSVANGTALNKATLRAADYLLSASVLYSDGNSGGGGGGIGGAFGSAVGLKTKTLQSQVMLTIVEVQTGLQVAVATGSARKRDITVAGGGLLLDLGVGALGGAYTSTPVGLVTAHAVLDAYRKIARNVQARTDPPGSATAPTSPAAPQPTAP
ncbi:hypothetical protein HNO88_002519 [Novosphingobium chloroacetimidivorans]|uniref:Curli production assembly/transport component CsgG n=1 Tax=Novosphingobium chloroacetimidivorans TaxID=1428314 RepID=A0A7W7NXH0_9SPHN|nr:CsgG/HfaB family protein [Novosphingobium chloroacetimidivorans]MBB4859190.1 hypothetical protein [Novosphingobium chloroacetimidivorans]